MRNSMILFFILFLLAGCNSHRLLDISDAPKSSEKNVSKSPIPVEFMGGSRQLQTLDMSGEAFNTVGEWYDNESILYVVDSNGGSEVYRYNIYTGEREIFTKTASTILTMKANEDHSIFLLQSSNSANQATITALDKQGSVLYEWDIESFDVSYSWNPYKSDQVFVTSFLQDWSYQTNLLDISDNSITKFEVFQPFIQWLDKNTISYLKWDQNELNYFAPLYSFQLEKKTEGLLFENIISFSTYYELLVTIELEQDREAYGKISFYNPALNKKLYEYSIPLLSDYSKWYIPFSDYATHHKTFYSFRPYSTASYDTYSKKFELVGYDLNSGKEDIILEEVDDLPLNLSPNGFLALYGYQFENIIDIKTKKVNQLVKF